MKKMLLAFLLMASAAWAGGPYSLTPTQYEIDTAISSVTASLATKAGLSVTNTFSATQTFTLSPVMNGLPRYLAYGSAQTMAPGETSCSLTSIGEDTHGMTNGNGFTAAVSGVYLVSFDVIVATNAARVYAHLTVNAGELSPVVYIFDSVSAATDHSITFSRALKLSKGQAIRLGFGSTNAAGVSITPAMSAAMLYALP